jgi:long-chain fatty acid transport protein
MTQRVAASRFAVYLVLGVMSLSLPARADRGHSLLGAGAVNSAMGGAGVALANDPLGALLLNPALLPRLDGNRFELSLEVSSQDSAVESEIGPFSGRTEGNDDAVLPAFAWTRHAAGSRAAFGAGVLPLSGFGVDYPQDSTNPILAPQPLGLGRTSSSFEATKLELATAWQVGDAFSFGFAVAAGRGELAAEPARFAAPNCSTPTVCFFPGVAEDSQWGFGLTVGAHYQIVPTVAIGVAYDTGLNFADFEWNAAVANPNLPSFGTNRQVSLALDSPPSLAVGVAFTPGEHFAVALDARQIGYESADGYDDVFGFENVTVLSAGVQWRAGDRFTVRAGYSHGDSPVPEASSFLAVSTPALVEDYAAVGFGFRFDDSLALDVAYYRGFEASIRGPFLSSSGPIPGASATNEASVDSAVASLSLSF